MTQTRFHALPDGRRIAFRHTAGTGPALVFLPGYLSDMTGGKAAAVFGWARAQGRECLLLDYSGCGQSDGDFAEGTLGRWRDEIVSVIEATCAGPAVLIGSSMGGWLMLLAGLELGERLAGLVGIAAAPDFTEWGTSAAHKAELAAGRPVFKANSYGPDPMPTYPRFWSDGQARRVLESEIALSCPVRLIHGQRDPDVPWELSLTLSATLRSDDVQVILIKDGDHRLSRDQDIAVLLGTLAALG